MAALELEVRSRLLPTIRWAPSGAGGPSGPPSWWERLLRPAVTLRAPIIGDTVWAPAGEPAAGAWFWVLTCVALFALAGVALAIYGAVRLLRR